MRALKITLLLALVGVAHAAPPATVNLVSLEAADLELWERTQRTSDSRPLTLDELEKLAAGGIGETTLIEMMRTRGVLVVADADTLLRLKKAGATDAVVGAVSSYAVPPNDGFDLLIEINVASPGSVAQAPYLYVEVWHDDLGRQEALMHADLRRLLAGAPAQRDRSDRLLGQTHRVVRKRVPITVRTAGKLTLRVLASQQPGLTGLSGVTSSTLKSFVIDYPGVSLERKCRLRLGLGRDPLLKDEYAIGDAQLDCRWD